MEKLIEALQIFLRYGNPRCPTFCTHEALYVVIDPSVVSDEDIDKLDKLSFFPDDEDECFCSFHYGNA